MQNELDNGTVLYTEQTDQSGFIVRDMLRTKSSYLRYQAGHYAFRPMEVPVYAVGNRISHHRKGDDIQVFKLEGFGRTLSEAIDNASTRLIRKELNR